MRSSWAPVPAGTGPIGTGNLRTLKTLSILFSRWLCAHMLILAALVLSILPQAGTIQAAGKQSTSARLEAEHRLSELGYWTRSTDRVWGSGFRHALIAFQKVEGRKRTGQLTADELLALRTATRPRPRFTGYRHVEVDLRRQVLFVVDDGDTVTRILPVCTGDGRLYSEGGQTGRAHTPRGRFKVTRKINGWRRSSLGLLYYPNYVFKGVAIHGSPLMPAYPASHGCIRIPMFAAREFSELTPVGTKIDIYDG